MTTTTIVVYTATIVVSLSTMNNKELLERFKALCQQKFNDSLSHEEATEMFTNLVNLVEVLVKPNPKKTSPNVNFKEKHEYETIRTY